MKSTEICIPRMIMNQQEILAYKYIFSINTVDELLKVTESKSAEISTGNLFEYRVNKEDVTTTTTSITTTLTSDTTTTTTHIHLQKDVMTFEQ